jgi:hypothetical protein
LNSAANPLQKLFRFFGTDDRDWFARMCCEIFRNGEDEAGMRSGHTGDVSRAD